jgi:hypothetical protein
VLTAVSPAEGAAPDSGVTELDGTKLLVIDPLPEATAKNHGVPFVRPVTRVEVVEEPDTNARPIGWLR